MLLLFLIRIYRAEREREVKKEEEIQSLSLIGSGLVLDHSRVFTYLN